MPMDLDAAAIALNTSKEMLLRWARQGVIPAMERHGLYEFDRRTLEQWAKRRRMPVKFSDGTEETSTEKPKGAIGDAMRRGGVYFGIPGGEVDAVLRNAVAAISLPESIDKAQLLERLLERESLASTGIGHGVAIPHPRHPLDGIPEGGIVSTCFLEAAIDYRAVDSAPVSVLFIILSPGTKRHLEMLARLTFCLHDAAFLPRLNACETADDFLRLVQQVEERFQDPSC